MTQKEREVEGRDGGGILVVIEILEKGEFST